MTMGLARSRNCLLSYSQNTLAVVLFEPSFHPLSSLPRQVLIEACLDIRLYYVSESWIGPATIPSFRTWMSRPVSPYPFLCLGLL